MVSFIEKVGPAVLGWISLVVVLFLAVFGVRGIVWILLLTFAVIAGFVAMLVQYTRQRYVQWMVEWMTRDMPAPAIGIPKLVDEMKSPKPHLKMDKRMTGSSTIDDVLHEILNYTYRDYIQSWYRRVSDDERFQYDMRLTLHRVVIALSERAKDIDLVPYFTRRLVDDFASHIRLYRRAIKKVREHQKDDTKPPAELEATFFELEEEMEQGLCRELVCLDEAGEREYLQDLSEVLMFLLLPQEDFHNKPFRYIVREVLVNGIFLPTINMVSDPDWMNQTISWLTKDSFFTNEYFLIILKTSDNIDELQATKEKVDLDIARQRSKDTGGHDDAEIKQQLSSLTYVRSVCEQRIEQLQKGVDDTDSLQGLDYMKLLTPGQKLYALPFDVVLNNNIALSYFIEFMTNIGYQHYLFFYLTVEGYRVSAEQQISAALLDEHGQAPDLEMLHDAALSIFHQYLSEKASPRIRVNERLYKLLAARITSPPGASAASSDGAAAGAGTERVFDEVQRRVARLLHTDPRFFPAFQQSQIYIRLLAELNLLDAAAAAAGKEGEDGEEEDGAVKGGAGIAEAAAMNGSPAHSPALSVKSCSSVTSAAGGDTSSLDSNSSQEGPRGASHGSMHPTAPVRQPQLKATIENKGICREHGKQYAVYLINVTRTLSDGTTDTWNVYRRYSDFNDLHTIITDKWGVLAGLALPSKKTFNNMADDFLEKRKVGLNDYLTTLLKPHLLSRHPGLYEVVFSFLEHMVWEKEKTELARKMDSMTKPLKNVGNFVRSMPDNFVDGVAKMSGGIKSIPNNMLDGVGKMLNVKGPSFANIVNAIMNDDYDDEKPPQGMSPAIKAQQILETMNSGKVGASLDIEQEGEDDIPLRILLLLMDEVFDLQERNQWLRRRIVAILRQIVRTMFGDSLNKKIVEQVEMLTSAEQISEYLKSCKDSLWPQGTLAESRPAREEGVQLRTRVVAKAKMLGTLADDLRHLLGSQTTRHGVLRVFNMFQHQTLNRRLAYVILEGILETIFPDNKFQEVFRKLHSRSSRRAKKSKSKTAAAAAAAAAEHHPVKRKR